MPHATCRLALLWQTRRLEAGPSALPWCGVGAPAAATAAATAAAESQGMGETTAAPWPNTAEALWLPTSAAMLTAQHMHIQCGWPLVSNAAAAPCPSVLELQCRAPWRFHACLLLRHDTARPQRRDCTKQSRQSSCA
jgi:hypothetical protein